MSFNNGFTCNINSTTKQCSCSHNNHNHNSCNCNRIAQHTLNQQYPNKNVDDNGNGRQCADYCSCGNYKTQNCFRKNHEAGEIQQQLRIINEHLHNHVLQHGSQNISSQTLTELQRSIAVNNQNMILELGKIRTEMQNRQNDTLNKQNDLHNNCNLLLALNQDNINNFVGNGLYSENQIRTEILQLLVTVGNKNNIQQRINGIIDGLTINVPLAQPAQQPEGQNACVPPVAEQPNDDLQNLNKRLYLLIKKYSLLKVIHSPNSDQPINFGVNGLQPNQTLEQVKNILVTSLIQLINKVNVLISNNR
jgi:hypothetical protein